MFLCAFIFLLRFLVHSFFCSFSPLPFFFFSSRSILFFLFYSQLYLQLYLQFHFTSLYLQFHFTFLLPEHFFLVSLFDPFHPCVKAHKEIKVDQKLIIALILQSLVKFKEYVFSETEKLNPSTRAQFAIMLTEKGYPGQTVLHSQFYVVFL